MTAKKDQSKKLDKNPNGRPPSFASPEVLKGLIEEYFANPKTHIRTKSLKGGGTEETVFELPFEITGLCLHLGCSRETLAVYSRGEHDHRCSPENIENNEKFSDVLTSAKLRIEQSLWNAGMNPDWNNSRGIMLNLQSNFNHNSNKRVESENVNLNVIKEADQDEDLSKLSVEDLQKRVMNRIKGES